MAQLKYGLLQHAAQDLCQRMSANGRRMLCVQNENTQPGGRDTLNF